MSTESQRIPSGESPIAQFTIRLNETGGSVAEWLACWTRAQKGPVSNRSRDAVGNRLRQTAHTDRASVHQAAKLAAAVLRVARVTAGLAESNGSLPPGLWLTSPASWLPRTGISSGTLRSAVEYTLPLPFYLSEISGKKTFKWKWRPAMTERGLELLKCIHWISNRTSSKPWYHLLCKMQLSKFLIVKKLSSSDLSDS